MTIYTVLLDNFKDKFTTFVDHCSDEYYAAKYTADVNTELVNDERYDVHAICTKIEIDKRFISGIKYSADVIEYTIYAEVVYDYLHDTIIYPNKRGIKYVSRRPYTYHLDKYNGYMKCFIPFEKNMESKLLKRCRYLYGRSKDKEETIKRASRIKLVHKAS